MSDWDAWLAERSDLRAARGVERFDPVLRLGGPRHGPRDPLDLASNDYLGLARDERVVGAAHEALDRYGASATASRLVTGTLPVHRDLEAALCRLAGQPSALAFSTGYAANLGVLTAFSGRGAEILLDAHAHASLHDAARMARAPYATFAHNDPAALDGELAARPDRRVVVAVESIYSVLGDAAPLGDLVEVCHRHGALLVVDEAHGIGVAGHGRGLVHELGLAGARDLVVTVTLSKALGSQGGAVLGSTAVRDHLVNTARSFIFDTALAPAAAAAACMAADIVAGDATLAAAVRANAGTIAAICGIEQAAGAVQSLPMPSPDSAVAAALELRAHGVLVGCFRPPSVPDGVSRLRVTARADLDGEDLFQAARLVARVAALHGAPRRPDTVEGPRAGDAPSPARGLPSVAAVEGPQGPVPPSPLGAAHPTATMSESWLPPVVLVTGTDTDVGKTVVTAAVVATALAAGLRVTAYKPTQTGVAPGDPGDMAEVERLTGVATVEGVRLRAPMAPRPAARLEGAGLPTLEDHVAPRRGAGRMPRPRRRRGCGRAARRADGRR